MRRSSSSVSTATSVARRTTPSTASRATTSAAGTHRRAAKRVEYEVEPRVGRIEQQLHEKLPAEWREFAGKPMQIQHYGTTINTFRENVELEPSEAYVKHAVKELRDALELEKASVFTDAELREIVHQEWRTDMTRGVWQTRLNRHDSKDGPVVRRSRSAVVSVTSQPKKGETFVVDALAHDKNKPSKNTRFT